MRSSWISGWDQNPMISVLMKDKRGEVRGTERRRGGGHVMTEAETGLM